MIHDRRAASSSHIAESSVLEPVARMVKLVVAVRAVLLVIAPPDVRDAEPAPAPELSARARQAIQGLL